MTTSDNGPRLPEPGMRIQPCRYSYPGEWIDVHAAIVDKQGDVKVFGTNQSDLTACWTMKHGWVEVPNLPTVNKQYLWLYPSGMVTTAFPHLPGVRKLRVVPHTGDLTDIDTDRLIGVVYLADTETSEQ